MAARVFGLGLVGAGSFGNFCLHAFRKLPNLKLVAVCDVDPGRAQTAATEFGLTVYTTFDALLADAAVEVVAINTPPASHAALSLAAVRAGKHVLCEKPLATALPDAEAVLRLVEQTGMAFSVDYVMRANPLYRLVKRLGLLQSANRPVLGELRRCSLENYAADENLGPEHWFWDPSVSGGIFVEHGVHFFDLFGWQLARRPDAVVALAQARQGAQVDTVQAIVSYPGGATSSSFHTFSHAGAGELQSIVFGWDWATAELHGWIALDLRLEALLDQPGLEQLTESLAAGAGLLAVPGEPLLPEASLRWQIAEQYPGGRTMRARGAERRVDARVVLEASLGGPAVKQQVYEQSVRANLAALLAAAEASQQWVVPPEDLWSSTAVALAAREAAATRQAVHWLAEAQNRMLALL